MNMYKVVEKNGEQIVKMGRFYSSIFKETLEHEMNEELGFCVMAYKDNPFLPTLIFFTECKNEVRGISNLEKSDVVYVNLYKKKRKEKWIMKISPLKGGEQ